MDLCWMYVSVGGTERDAVKDKTQLGPRSNSNNFWSIYVHVVWCKLSLSLLSIESEYGSEKCGGRLSQAVRSKANSLKVPDRKQNIRQKGFEVKLIKLLVHTKVLVLFTWSIKKVCWSGSFGQRGTRIVWWQSCSFVSSHLPPKPHRT